MLRKATYVLGALLLATVSAANAENWHAAKGAVTCQYYTAMNEAQKSRNSPSWFAETGCKRQMADIPLTVISAPPGLAAMQVRLHKAEPETVWIHPYEVLTTSNTQRPMHYLDASRGDFEAILRHLSNDP